MERDGVLNHQVVQAGQGSKTLSLPIKSDYAPNVYVSVLGLSPRGDFPVHAGRYDTEAPGFVWGMVNLAVHKEPEGLEVKISPEAPELKAEPGTGMTLNLTVTDPRGKGVEAEIAVAVVDESVLALTGFKTPTLERLTRFDLPYKSIHRRVAPRSYTPDPLLSFTDRAPHRRRRYVRRDAVQAPQTLPSGGLF